MSKKAIKAGRSSSKNMPRNYNMHMVTKAHKVWDPPFSVSGLLGSPLF